jgi:Rrf2 family iron-sulfur cluster assembly transcriptional regulator
LVSSARGPGGGYRLSKPIDQISVADVIAAVDESVDATRCGGAKNCHGKERCLTHDLWEELSHEIESFLGRISLGTLVARGTRAQDSPPETRTDDVSPPESGAVEEKSVPVWRIRGRRI